MLPRLHIVRKNMRHILRQLRRFSSDSPRPIVATSSTSKVSPQKAEPPTKPLEVERKERVINLDSPRDLRTPLPGNVGFCLRSYTDIVQLSKIPGATTINDFLKDFTKPKYISRSDGERLNLDCFYEKRDPLVIASDYMECEIYDCPALVKSDFEKLFPHHNLSAGSFTAILFSHKTESDMSIWTQEMEQEREQLIHMFKNSAQELTSQLGEYGFWVEYVDPHNGTMVSHGNKKGLTSATLYETDDRYRHFGLDIQDLGCCKVINHKQWGTNAFIGSVFTNAPAESELLRHLTFKYFDLFYSKL